MIQPDTYNNDRKFIFSNWTEEDFTGQWAGVSYTVLKGETKEFPMYLAYHLTKHLVDREMNRAGKSHLLGVEEERAIFETKTVSEIGEGTDSPALASLKEKIREEVLEVEAKKAKKTKKEAPIEDTGEFADLK